MGPQTDLKGHSKTNHAAGDSNTLPLASEFKPLHVFGFVALIFIGVSLWTNWYTQQVSLPRYCGNIAETMINLEKVLTELKPAGNEARRPYLIAAKLIFIVPRASEEPLDVYLNRVRAHIDRECL